MTSLVYSRKWRPQRFAEVAGQEHVVTTLRQAVLQGRIAHSYLFCGPRGTGKTTTARLLAKASNCHDLQQGDPCNTCPSCQAINEGRFLDVIELDAASNRGIDEIRNIRDKVHFAPGEGRRKVYIIDEAHMLTEQASNAFLKTLEEPPDHAVFVLCTTEAHKLLPTIVSRCQRFDFRRLSPGVIVERLQQVCQDEGIVVDDEALQALARYAAGSLRDAENLLEQLVVSFGSPVGMAQVQELLGLGHTDRALELVQCTLMGNTASALGVINRAAWDGIDLRQLHRQATELIRGVMAYQLGAGESLDLAPEVATEVGRLASRTNVQRSVRALRLFAQVDLRRDAPSPLSLELAVVETGLEEPHPPASNTGPRASAVFNDGPARGVPERPRATASPPSRPAPAALPRQAPAPSPPDSEPEASAPAASGEDAFRGDSAMEGWGELVRALSRARGRRFNIGALLRDCKGQQVDGDILVLSFAHRSHLERMQEEMEDPQSRKTVQEALTKALGRSYELRLTMAEDSEARALPSPTDSPLVRYAMNLGARIVEDPEP